MNNTTMIPTPEPTNFRPYYEGLNGNDDSLNVILPVTLLLGSVLLVGAALYCYSCFKDSEPPSAQETYFYLPD